MISNSKVFSKVDLKDAFNQIAVSPESKDFTAFYCYKGTYKYNVMPFGLRNTPATFQRMIDSVLGDLLGKCCVTYLDDILIFLTNLDTNHQDVIKVLKKIQDANLKLKREKCEFFKSEVTFLGNIIFCEGHAICPDKLSAI